MTAKKKMKEPTELDLVKIRLDLLIKYVLTPDMVKPERIALAKEILKEDDNGKPS